MALPRFAQPQERGGARPSAQHGSKYLTFSAAGEMYAISISVIKEIIEYRSPTDVPMMPDYMRGVINLRGRVVPVIDLSARFSRGRSDPNRRSCFVIVELRQQDHAMDIGVLVDAVSAVLEITDADIEPPPNFGVMLRADFICGMGKVGDAFVILLDVDKVLSVEELSALEQVGTDATAAAPSRLAEAQAGA
jgi:purine-binding chemotaxis protein CheW